MTKLAIIHYMPLEYYPPVTNFLDILTQQNLEKFESVKVFSCQNVMGRPNYAIPPSDKPTKLLTLKRSPFPKDSDKLILRIYKYIHFNLFTLWSLILQWPNNILYYESFSAWPAYIYSRYCNPRCRIFIHNHEYADKTWYATAMLQVRYFHHLEKKWLYARAVWNSQTNIDRLNLFRNDQPSVPSGSLTIMPNYPPQTWKSKFETSILNTQLLKESSSKPIKVVYVGSLSFQGTYLKEFCDWVIHQNGLIQFDIYAYNLYEDVKEYLNNLESPNINYYENGIEYKKIPNTISNYDVGIIFYKPYSKNVINCVSNKFFEYFACGLDIWFSTEMKSTLQHITNGTFPIVIPVDFSNLFKFNWQAAIEKKEKTYKPSDFYCEKIYAKLILEITRK